MYYVHGVGLYYDAESDLYYDYDTFPHATYQWNAAANAWWPVELGAPAGILQH